MRCEEVGGGAIVVMVHFQFSWLHGLGKVSEGCSNIQNEIDMFVIILFLKSKIYLEHSMSSKIFSEP